MPPIRFLTRERIVAVHEEQIARYGGSAGIRDEGLLASAIAMPTTSFGGQAMFPTVPDVATAYLFYLAKNHPFVDGNKRVAAAAALFCLRLNNHDWQVPPTEYAEFVLKLAAGQLGKDEALELFRTRAFAVSPD